MKSRHLRDSFRFAMEGLVYAIRSHQHMRYMLIIAALVLLASQVLGVDKIGLMALVFSIALLIITELINAAIEAAVDLACDSYHPLAKVAKDIGGAAVMVASSLTVFIGALVFLKATKISYLLGLTSTRPGPDGLQIALVGIALMAIIVILGKVWGKKGTLWRGGAVSGHSAIAAFLLASITYKAGSNPLIFGLALGLTFLVAQSRLEAGFHTLREVLIGLVVGLAVSALMFRFLV